ncbi:MAG: metalloregulator ArsR/SmtB family transcription factor [Oscillospiraceae bacterium]|jgi:ArsR family transcriptional regulator|nr:winged helix-turn-helix transcriptional regulator [Clostridiales bacterium]MDD4095821.1 metalloregulator ArsR/SmtB family transcription factor [Oscillospiraceae bacterium]
MNHAEFLRRTTIMKVLAHPDRLFILRGLYLSRCKVGEIQEKMGLTQSGLSQHLSKMRDVGIIVGERSGKEICYRVTDDFAIELMNSVFKDMTL